MSWIKLIDETQATGKLKEIYDKIKCKRGKISNIMKVHSLNPDAMEKHLELYISLMFGRSKLSREERELIAVIVSSANNCSYCVNHHAEALNHYWKNRNLITKLIRDFQSVDLPQKKRTMINYVLKVTKRPSSVRKKDIDELREAGFDDRDILDINLIASYFNFVNRIALGLGVSFSEDEVKGYDY